MTDISGTIIKNQRITGDISGSSKFTGDIVSGKNLKGNISKSSSIEGTIENSKNISGSIGYAKNFSGTMSSSGNLIGTVYAAMDHSGIEIYHGPYNATPTADIQILETKFKKLIDNVTIEATPISDTQTAGTDGYTITVL